MVPWRGLTPGGAQDVKEAIAEAQADCKDGSAAECAAAWDVVEEISAAKGDAKAKAAANPSDPLEAF